MFYALYNMRLAEKVKTKCSLGLLNKYTWFSNFFNSIFLYKKNKKTFDIFLIYR